MSKVADMVKACIFTNRSLLASSIKLGKLVIIEYLNGVVGHLGMIVTYVLFMEFKYAFFPSHSLYFLFFLCTLFVALMCMLLKR